MRFNADLFKQYPYSKKSSTNKNDLFNWIRDNIYDKPYPNDLQRHEIARYHHGSTHVGRAGLYCVPLANLFKLFGDKDAAKLTADELELLSITLFLHDSGREGDGADLWDIDSATNVYYFLRYSLKLSRHKAVRFAEAMANKDFDPSNSNKYYCLKTYALDNKLKWVATKAAKKNIYSKIIHDADCLDVNRARQLYDAKKLNFYQDNVGQNHASDALMVMAALITEVKSLITLEGDHFKMKSLDTKKTLTLGNNPYDLIDSHCNSFPLLKLLKRALPELDQVLKIADTIKVLHSDYYFISLFPDGDGLTNRQRPLAPADALIVAQLKQILEHEFLLLTKNAALIRGKLGMYQWHFIDAKEATELCAWFKGLDLVDGEKFKVTNSTMECVITSMIRLSETQLRMLPFATLPRFTPLSKASSEKIAETIFSRPDTFPAAIAEHTSIKVIVALSTKLFEFFLAATNSELTLFLQHPETKNILSVLEINPKNLLAFCLTLFKSPTHHNYLTLLKYLTHGSNSIRLWKTELKSPLTFRNILIELSILPIECLISSLNTPYRHLLLDQGIIYEKATIDRLTQAWVKLKSDSHDALRNELLQFILENKNNIKSDFDNWLRDPTDENAGKLLLYQAKIVENLKVKEDTPAFRELVEEHAAISRTVEELNKAAENQESSIITTAHGHRIDLKNVSDAEIVLVWQQGLYSYLGYKKIRSLAKSNLLYRVTNDMFIAKRLLIGCNIRFDPSVYPDVPARILEVLASNQAMVKIISEYFIDDFIEQMADYSYRPKLRNTVDATHKFVHRTSEIIPYVDHKLAPKNKNYFSSKKQSVSFFLANLKSVVFRELTGTGLGGILIDSRFYIDIVQHANDFSTFKPGQYVFIFKHSQDYVLYYLDDDKKTIAIPTCKVEGLDNLLLARSPIITFDDLDCSIKQAIEQVIEHYNDLKFNKALLAYDMGTTHHGWIGSQESLEAYRNRVDYNYTEFKDLLNVATQRQDKLTEILRKITRSSLVSLILVNGEDSKDARSSIRRFAAKLIEKCGLNLSIIFINKKTFELSLYSPQQQLDDISQQHYIAHQELARKSVNSMILVIAQQQLNFYQQAVALQSSAGDGRIEWAQAKERIMVHFYMKILQDFATLLKPLTANRLTLFGKLNKCIYQINEVMACASRTTSSAKEVCYRLRQMLGAAMKVNSSSVFLNKKNLTCLHTELCERIKNLEETDWSHKVDELHSQKDAAANCDRQAKPHLG